MASQTRNKNTLGWSALKIVLIYAAVGAALNLALDYALGEYISDSSLLTIAESAKAWVFLFTTVVLLYCLLIRVLKRQSDSDAYNRVLFEESTIGLALTRIDGELVDVNAAFANIIGRTIDETLQLTYWEITPEKYHAAEQEQLLALKEIGRYGPFEKEYIHKDGHLVNVRLQGLLLEVAGDKMIWSSVEDISASTRAKKLREEQIIFQDAVLDCVADGLMACDQYGKLTYINRTLRILLGYSNGSAESEEWGESFSFYDADGQAPLPKHRLPMFRALNGEVVQDQELAVTDKSKRRVLLSATGRALQKSSGEVLGAVVSFRDITEQKSLQLDEAKRQEEVTRYNETLATLIKDQSFVSADFPGFLVSLTEVISEILHVTRVGVWMLGKTANALKCVNLWDSTTQTHSSGDVLNARDYPSYFESVLSDRVLAFDDVYTHPNTVEFVAEYFPSNSITSMLDAPFHFAGEINGVVCLEHTGPKRVWKVEEKAFVISIADLLSVVSESSHRLSLEAALHRSKKMDALSNLTGGIAHDYNNMLGVIIGYANLLELELKDDERLSAYVSAISLAGKRGARLASKLLTVVRKSSSDEEVIDVNELLLGQKDLLEKTLTARISLSIKTEPDLWSVKINPSDLEDVILNICINAMHAIAETGSLVIKTSNVLLSKKEADVLQVQPGKFVGLSFRDTGCGMEQSELEIIFDPFYTTKGDQGTGLGLAQVYGFARQSEGAVSVSSVPGVGTEFSIFIPVIEGPAGEVPRDVPEISAAEVRGQETILVVDDEEALLQLSKELLQRRGYVVLCAENGKQALDVLENNNIDLLLTDAIMGEMGGYELAGIVRKKWPNIKIQMVSGYAHDADEGAVDSDLVNNALAKPFEIDTYYARIRELLDEK